MLIHSGEQLYIVHNIRVQVVRISKKIKVGKNTAIKAKYLHSTRRMYEFFTVKYAI